MNAEQEKTCNRRFHYFTLEAREYGYMNWRPASHIMALGYSNADDDTQRQILALCVAGQRRENTMKIDSERIAENRTRVVTELQRLARIAETPAARAEFAACADTAIAAGALELQYRDALIDAVRIQFCGLPAAAGTRDDVLRAMRYVRPRGLQ